MVTLVDPTLTGTPADGLMTAAGAICAMARVSSSASKSRSARSGRPPTLSTPQTPFDELLNLKVRDSGCSNIPSYLRGGEVGPGEGVGCWSGMLEWDVWAVGHGACAWTLNSPRQLSAA